MSKQRHSEGWRDRESVGVPAVAEILDVSRTAVYDLAARGHIPGVFKVGRLVRFRVREFAAWFDRGARLDKPPAA